MEKLRLELEKEKIKTGAMQREVDVQKTDLDTVKEQFQKYKKELDDMNW
jgi:hypothetical protein